MFAFVGVSGFTLSTPQTETYAKPRPEKLPLEISPLDLPTTADILRDIDTDITEIILASEPTTAATESKPKTKESPVFFKKTDIFDVPFYSQFTDISSAKWQKVGCGIASLAMLIEFYEPDSVTVDNLLSEGIAAGAYLSDAGWTHAGLINLSKKYGLTGASHDMAGSSMDSAFSKLESVLKEGPVMVSVHYTFDPQNPIPHLVVISGVNDGQVYYNDPAEDAGGGSLSISKFQKAWKKRYIEIRSTT
jgi:uncharacterized protein YvpB